MNPLVLHKPQKRKVDLPEGTVEVLMVETASLAEASYYWAETSCTLITNFFVKENRFYISLTDVSCRLLEEVYKRFTGNNDQERYTMSRSYIESCHFFESMRELYKGGRI